MNEKLNLVEILKDCPNGMELDCTMFDNVKFIGVENYEKPICIRIGNKGTYFHLTQYGTLDFDENAKCVIYPKDKTTWEGFIPPCKFNDGDIVATNSGLQVFILQRQKSYSEGYCYIGYDFGLNDIFHAGKWQFSRLATEEEKQKLFRAIKNNGYKWNAETNTLDKLIKPKFKVGDKIVNRVSLYMGDLSHQDVISEITEDKYILNDGGYIHIKNQDIWELAHDKKQRFDPKTLSHFDKVICRNGFSSWRCDFFSSYREGYACPNVCVGCSYTHCIPYNEDTKHLVGTDDEAPEYYRYWEE